MNKKLKSLLVFSAVSLAIGVAGQFYTNYKIDQTLSQFPYQLKNQFTIHVSEKNRDFITRDLIFTLEQGEAENSAQPIEFMHTKLTALPGIINAESEINAQLIKKLNEQLNITIDKNTITNQLVVFSDNLSSHMVTEFRDGTNKAQILETDLNYSNQHKTIELQTQLSGFNYEKTLGIKELKGVFLLHPINQTLYDLSKADLQAKKIDITLLDGDNTHIGIVKPKSHIEKKNNQAGYDLIQQISTDGIYISNKMTKSDEEKPRSEGINLNLTIQGVPSQNSLLTQLGQVQLEKIDLNKSMQWIMDFIFNNQQFNTIISADSFILPAENVELKKSKLAFNADNQNKQSASNKWTIDIEQLRFQTSDNNTINLTGLHNENQITQLNLQQQLEFLAKYMPKDPQFKANSQQRKAFLADLSKITEDYHANMQNQLQIKQIAVKDLVNLENLNWLYQENMQKQDLNITANLELEKLNYIQQQAQFNQTKLTIPAKFTIDEQAKQFYVLLNSPIYQLTSSFYLENSDNLLSIVPSLMQFEIKQGNFSTKLNSYPKSGENFPLNMQFDINSALTKNTDIFTALSNSQYNFKLKASAPLAAMQADKPNTDFWAQLQQAIEQYFVKGEQDYAMEFTANNGEYLLNGKLLSSEEPPQNAEQNSPENELESDSQVVPTAE